MGWAAQLKLFENGNVVSRPKQLLTEFFLRLELGMLGWLGWLGGLGGLEGLAWAGPAGRGGLGGWDWQARLRGLRVGRAGACKAGCTLSRHTISIYPVLRV